MAHERIKVLDWKAYGLLIIEWAKNPAARPTTLDNFKRATAGILELPSRITEAPIYPQWTLSNFVVRLPSPELVQDTMEELKAAGKYPAPGFYTDLVSGTLQGVDAFYHRVGDYTISQCQ